MNKFRYSVDLGAGFVSVDVYDLDCSLEIQRSEHSPIFAESKLDGQITFIGSVAVSMYAKRTTSYYIPLKIEEFNGTIWNELHRCYIDIRGEYYRSEKKLKVNSFKQYETPESKIIAQLNTRVNIRDLVSQNQITSTITSETLEISFSSSIVDPFDYPNFFDIGSIAYPSPDGTYQDERWNYFEVYSTTPLGGGVYSHVYRSKTFKFAPGIDNGSYGFYKINFRGVNYWAKKPIYAAFANETITNAVLLQLTYKFEDILDAIINAFDSTLEFDPTDSGLFSPTSFNRYYFGSTSEFNHEMDSNTKIEITLKEFFSFFSNYDILNWYIDGTKIKFETLGYKYYTDTYDYSLEPIDKNKYTFIYNPMPDYEIYATADKSQYPYKIAYFEKGVQTDNNTFDYSVDWFNDFWELRKQKESNDNVVIIRFDGTSVYPFTNKQWFYKSGYAKLYSEYVPYYIKEDVTLTYGLTNDGSSVFNRPLYKLSISKWLNDYSAFNVISRIKIDADNTGYCEKIKINLKTGDSIIDIHFATLVL